jgi:hypothetical protein
LGHHHLLVVVHQRLPLDLRRIVPRRRHLLVHAHALLVFHLPLLVRHIASLTHKAGSVLLLLLRPVAENVAALTLNVGALLIAYHLVDAAVSVIVLAARWHLLLVLVVDLLALVLQQPLRSRVRRVSGELSPSLLRVVDRVGRAVLLVHVVRLLRELTALVGARRSGGGLLEVQIHTICAHVQDLLRVHLLLLVQRYLVVELLQKLLRVGEHVVLLEVLLVVPVVLSIVFLLVPRVYHRLVLGQGRQMVVIVVAIELCLDGVTAQVLTPFDEVRVIKILPLLADVLLIVIVVRGRDERRPELLLVEVLPREVGEPRMTFDFVAAVVAESVLRLSLDHLVDEVRGLYAPPDRNFLLLDLDLLRQDIVSDVFSRLSNIRPFAVHALISHNSHSKIVHGERVILPTHDLRSHVPGRAGRVLRVLLSPISCDSEIGDPEVPLVVDDEVLRLDVSVYNLLLMAVFEPGHEARNEEACIFERVS